MALIGCHHEKPQDGFGGQWRSWTPQQRQLYVGGFLDGTASAQADLCETISREAEVLKFRNRLDPYEDPCMQLRTSYSHVEVGRGLAAYTSAYTSVIDDFYKHPECRMMPYSTLLEHLDDKEYKSGEDLYKFVRSGPEWGSFSIEGIANCYGIDAKRD